jgi:hypothetical protein
MEKRKDILKIARETLPKEFQNKRTDKEIAQILLDMHDIIDSKQLDCYPSNNAEGETVRVYSLYK